MNMKSCRSAARVAAVLGVAVVAGALLWGREGAAQRAPSDPDRVDRTSRRSFAQTLERLESTLQSEHMMIVARIDHKNMLSMVGARIGGSTTIEFGKPDMGRMLLPMNPAIGLEMPAKIYVYETADHRVVVSYRKVGRNFATYGDPQVAQAGEMMDGMLDRITAAVIR